MSAEYGLGKRYQASPFFQMNKRTNERELDLVEILSKIWIRLLAVGVY